jgi:hypothetical protein
MFNTPEAHSASGDFTPEILARLDELIRMGHSNPAEAIPLVAQFFDNNADALWHTLGDAAREARRAIASQMAAGCPLLTQSYFLEAQDMATQLAGDAGLPLLRLMAENVAVNWLASAEADRTATLSLDRSESRIECLERRRSNAHRRYQQALRSLATVRKLLRVTAPPVTTVTKRKRTGSHDSTAGRPGIPASEANVDDENPDDRREPDQRPVITESIP